MYQVTWVLDLTKNKLAEVIANHLVDFLQKNSIDESLQCISDDWTNLNIGWEGGVIRLRQSWLVSALLTNAMCYISYCISYMIHEWEAIWNRYPMILFHFLFRIFVWNCWATFSIDYIRSNGQCFKYRNDCFIALK